MKVQESEPKAMDDWPFHAYEIPRGEVLSSPWATVSIRLIIEYLRGSVNPLQGICARFRVDFLLTFWSEYDIINQLRNAGSDQQ